MRVLLSLPIALAMTGCAFVSSTAVDQQKASFDGDGDGVVGAVHGGADCDDSDATIGPFADEVCNGIDDNCDGSTDEGLTSLVYADEDGDGVGFGEAVEVCTDDLDETWAAVDGDCDPVDPLAAPGLDEAPCDGIDNDCDGEVDNIDATLTFYVDDDNDGFGDPNQPVQSCEGGANLVSNADDCDDTQQLVHPNAQEWCDYIDNNCNGSIDDNAVDAREWFEDADGDGIGGSNMTTSCEPPAGPPPWTELSGDCDDSDGVVYPGAQELCDSKDNDCDGQFDEETPNWWPDADGDGFGDEGAPATANCDAPPMTVGNATDCNDADPLTFPGSDEVCGGADEDCDGVTDEDDAVDAPLWYTDADVDGYGDPSTAVPSCTNPGGLVGNDLDCDDADAALNPDTVWYADTDGDSFGDPDSSQNVCAQPADHVLDDQDCDDTAVDVNPSATEVCDTIDNDCDGGVDVGLTTPYYLDNDDDGFGDASDAVEACAAPAGRVTDDTDCDDSLDYVYPGADEACDDSSDYDCDNEVDWDRDGDGFSDASCPSGGGTDCLDSDPDVYPGKGCAEPDCWAWLHEQGETSDGIYDIDPDGPGNGVDPFPVYCDMTRNGGGWTLLFEDDFDGGAESGWSDTTTTTCDGDEVLGGYGELGNGDHREISLDAFGIAHDVLWFEGAFLQIDSWDGEAHWLELGGGRVWADRWHHRDGTTHRCGNSSTNAWRERTWDQDWMLAHSDTGTFDLRYEISDANAEDAQNESAGLDYVAVWVNRFASPSPGSSDTEPALSCAHVLAADAGATDGPYWIDPDGPGSTAPMQLECNMSTDGGGWTVIFFDDMNPIDPGWSTSAGRTCGGLGEIMGGPNQLGKDNSPTIDVDTFGIAHHQARIEFDYIYTDQWDSGERGYLDVELHNRWNEVHFDGSNNYCGSSNDDGLRTDQVVTIEHGRPEVSLRFRNNLDNGNKGNESMGIDNVEVWIR